MNGYCLNFLDGSLSSIIIYLKVSNSYVIIFHKRVFLLYPQAVLNNLEYSVFEAKGVNYGNA